MIVSLALSSCCCNVSPVALAALLTDCAALWYRSATFSVSGAEVVVSPAEEWDPASVLVAPPATAAMAAAVYGESDVPLDGVEKSRALCGATAALVGDVATDGGEGGA